MIGWCAQVKHYLRDFWFQSKKDEDDSKNWSDESGVSLKIYGIWTPFKDEWVELANALRTQQLNSFRPNNEVDSLSYKVFYLAIARCVFWYTNVM
jgi:ribosomal protein L19E